MFCIVFRFFSCVVKSFSSYIVPLVQSSYNLMSVRHASIHKRMMSEIAISVYVSTIATAVTDVSSSNEEKRRKKKRNESRTKPFDRSAKGQKKKKKKKKKKERKKKKKKILSLYSHMQPKDIAALLGQVVDAFSCFIYIYLFDKVFFFG